MSKSRILVVDDARHIAYLLRFQLERAGYEVRVENDGLSVLETAVDFEPAAVILDVILPGKSGFDLCADLRRDPRTANVRVIFHTGHAWEEVEDQVGDGGADAHFTKPVSPHRLLQKLDELGVSPEPGVPVE